MLKHELQIGNRSRRRAPNLTSFDGIVLGLISLFVKPRRIPMLAAIVKPATLFRFHRALIDRKYRRLFSCSGKRNKPGPKGPSPDLITAIVEMKSCNPGFGHPFVERLIGTIRREYLDHVFFWDAADLARKLHEFGDYYNSWRAIEPSMATRQSKRLGRPYLAEIASH